MSTAESANVVEFIVEKKTLTAFAKLFYSKPTGMESPLVQEIKLHVNDDGLYAIAVDAATVGMVEAEIDAAAFPSYDAPGAATVGLGLGKLLDFLGPAGADEQIEFALDMETRSVDLNYGGTSMSMALIDPEAVRQEPDLPSDEDLSLVNDFAVEASELEQAVDVADMVSDHIAISAGPGDPALQFRADGDVDEVEHTVTTEDLIDGDLAEDVRSLYSVDYVRSMTLPMISDAEVRIKLGEEMPVKLHWQGLDGHLDVTQMIAPRIESG